MRSSLRANTAGTVRDAVPWMETLDRGVVYSALHLSRTVSVSWGRGFPANQTLLSVSTVRDSFQTNSNQPCAFKSKNRILIKSAWISTSTTTLMMKPPVLSYLVVQSRFRADIVCSIFRKMKIIHVSPSRIAAL